MLTSIITVTPYMDGEPLAPKVFQPTGPGSYTEETDMRARALAYIDDLLDWPGPHIWGAIAWRIWSDGSVTLVDYHTRS